MKNSKKTIWVKGLWHQGLVAAGVWAQRGFRVYAICDSQEEVAKFEKLKLPIFEPGLDNLISEQMSKRNLFFSVANDQLPAPDFLCLMHDTAVNDDDEVQLDYFFGDINSLSKYITPDVEVLVTAQVPAGTCQLVIEMLNNALNFCPRVSYMPENLRLGQAISRFEHPELPVIGISNTKSKLELALLFSNEIEINYCQVIEAEILKSALNSFLALSITFGNEISEICDRLGASGSVVMRLLKLENRIGSKLPILPGLPFSGGTLGRDVQNLRKLSGEGGAVIDAIWSSNLNRKKYFISAVAKWANDVSELNIGLLGLTYKTGTSTLRRSYALQTAKGLSDIGYTVFGFDPIADQFDEEVPRDIHLCSSLEEIFAKCNVIVLMTPWDSINKDLRACPLIGKMIIDPYGSLPDELAKACNYIQFGGWSNA